MPELGENFWHGWVIGLTVLSLGALVWLTLSVYFSRRAQGGPSDAVWDDDLREEANPAPWWWFALLLGLLVFTVVYLVLYPGLGDYPGMLKWTQESQISQSAARDTAAHDSRRARWRNMTASELATDTAAMQTAARVFRHNCAACHGDDARGIPGIAPNLTDAAWTWGGGEAQIIQTITAGRIGVMPPLGAALGDDGVAEVAQFVLHGLGRDGDGDNGTGTPPRHPRSTLPRHPRSLLSGGGDGDGTPPRHPRSPLSGGGDGGVDGETLAAGRTKYQQFCAACHGPAGQGNPALGAPDLTDAAWLYGGDLNAIRTSIRDGRSNQMPPQAARLTETQLRLLVAWLLRNAPK